MRSRWVSMPPEPPKSRLRRRAIFGWVRLRNPDKGRVGSMGDQRLSPSAEKGIILPTGGGALFDLCELRAAEGLKVAGSDRI